MTLARKERWEQQVRLGGQVCPDAPEIPVPLVTPVRRELLDCQDSTASQESQGIQVKGECLA